MRRLLKFTLISLCIAVVLAVATAAAGGVSGDPGPPSGGGVQPVFTPDNPTCGDLSPGTFELKVEPVVDGTFSDGFLSVTIDVRDTADGQVFDWTSNIGVDSIFVKGGPDGNFYQYDPPSESTGDTSLHAPINPSNNKFFGLSHISFCYDIVPSIKVEKTGDELSKVGDEVTYKFQITNDGDITLNRDDVSDTLLGDLNAAASAAGCDELDPGEFCSFDVTRTVEPGDPDPLDNTVTVMYSGTLPDGSTATVTDSDDHSVNLFQPSVALDKTGDELSKVGDEVRYTITVTNTSSSDTPRLHCTISDPTIGFAGSAELDPGVTASFGIPFTIPDGADDPFKNTATATCNPDGFTNVVSAEDSHEVELFQPSVDIEKKAEPTLTKVGHDVTYTIDVTNTSSADSPNLTCDVTDSLLGLIADDLNLAPGGSQQFIVVRTVQAGDPDPLVNTATATCNPDGFPNEVSDEASATVELFQPSVDIEKKAEPTLTKVGHDVTYTIDVTNTSSADSPNLTCDVTDSLLGLIADDLNLAPGGSQQFIVVRTVQAADPDPLLNNATADCTVDGFGNKISDEATATVELFQPAVKLGKEVDTERSKVGDTIGYTITVENTSSADSPNITCDINDSLLGPIADDLNLAPGDSQAFSVPYVVQATDLDPLVNTATADCTVDGFGNKISAEASATVELFQPAIQVVKDGPAEAAVGDTITYSFAITNNSSADSPDLILDSVSDTVLGDLTATAAAAGCGTLASGASCNFTVDFTIPADAPNPLVNVVTVHYHPDGFTNDIKDDDDHSVRIVVPFEGCTPGFWKNHLDAWVPTGFSPNQTLESVFDVPNSFGLDNRTLLQALSFPGGNNLLGAARNLLRAAVAALLNSAHPDVDYPRTTAEVIADVNAALASNNRQTMIDLAAELDADNNLGGDLCQ